MCINSNKEAFYYHRKWFQIETSSKCPFQIGTRSTSHRRRHTYTRPVYYPGKSMGVATILATWISGPSLDDVNGATCKKRRVAIGSPSINRARNVV